MGSRRPEPEPRERLHAWLRDRSGLLVERWERHVLDDPRRPEERRSPALRDHVPGLIDRIAARLQRGAGEGGPLTEDWAQAGDDAPTPDDLPTLLGELGHLRAAILELCAAEGVRLEGEAALLVHGAIDEAMVTVGGALARRAIAAGERERERLDLTLRLLPVGVFIADARGRIITMNDAAVRFWGAMPLVESVAEFDMFRAYRPGASEPIAAEEWGLARALRGEAPLDEDLEIVSFDGERRTICNSALALRDADGTITGGVAVNVEITDRKRTERRLAAILEGALDAIVLLDASGLITEFNPAAEQIFGYARGEAIGRELAELVMDPAQREAHRRGLRRYLATGETRMVGRRAEIPATRADGTTFDAELTVIRLPTGGPVAFAGFVRDITERRRAEIERARAAELRERVLGIVSHDLRTPLSAIALSAQSLLLQEGLGEGQLRALQRIVRSADRMERMIRDLLDFARSRQGGGIPVTPEPGDLAAICRQVLEEIALTHAGRAVTLRCQGSAHGRWDPDRVAQVIQNLVVNALDHSPPDTPVEVAIDDAGERVVLTVKNEGPPIPKEMLTEIFDPFRRGAQAARGAAARGLGLGLYIAQEIARAHRGRVGAESDEERGTRFFVELPRSVPQTA